MRKKLSLTHESTSLAVTPYTSYFLHDVIGSGGIWFLFFSSSYSLSRSRSYTPFSGYPILHFNKTEDANNRFHQALPPNGNRIRLSQSRVPTETRFSSVPEATNPFFFLSYCSKHISFAGQAGRKFAY